MALTKKVRRELAAYNHGYATRIATPLGNRDKQAEWFYSGDDRLKVEFENGWNYADWSERHAMPIGPNVTQCPGRYKPCA